MKTVLYALFLLGCLRLSVASAQVTPVDTTGGRSYYILLKDGSYMQGQLIKRDSVIYTVRMKNGQLTYVERSLFDRISWTPPTRTDSAGYVTAVPYAQPGITGPGSATVSPDRYTVTLRDGTILNGQLISQDSQRLVLRTDNIGIVNIPADQIRRMDRGAGDGVTRPPLARGSATYPNRFPQYLNFLPTAYQAERGRLYYRNTITSFSQFDLGITDNWSVGYSFVTFVPTLLGALSTKVSVPLTPRVRLGVQGQLIYTSLTYRPSATGFVQGMVSIGESQNNVTIGYGTTTEANSVGSLLSVSLVRKLSPRLTLISENVLILDRSNVELGKLSGGLRFDRARHSFDLSVNLPFGPDGLSRYFPLLFSGSYQVRFGKAD